MHFKMDHIVLNTGDIASSLHFYTEIIELHGERIEEFKNDQVPFRSVRITQDNNSYVYFGSLGSRRQLDTSGAGPGAARNDSGVVSSSC